MTPDTTVSVLVAIAVVLIVAGMTRSWYRGMQQDRLNAEASAHLPMRRRVGGLVRRGARSATEPVQENRFGWWWIWANVDVEVMGVAWTRRGARRQLQAYLRHLSAGARPPRHVVVKREKPPRRRPVHLPLATVPPEAAT